jgi:hypothetical protein
MGGETEDAEGVVDTEERRAADDGLSSIEGMSIDDLGDTVRALKKKHYCCEGGLSPAELKRYLEAKRLFSSKIAAMPVSSSPSDHGIDVDGPSAIFVAVLDDGQHLRNSVRNIGVFASLHAAKNRAWRTILEEALKPWSRAFYEDRDGEFADFCGIPHVSVEEWSWRSHAAASAPVATHPIGWRRGDDNGHQQQPAIRWFDAALKREHARFAAYVEGLLRDLPHRFPRE